MPSISVLSSCGLAVAHLCYFVSMWLRSFSSLSLLYNGANALAFVPGAGVRGMKGARAECSIHPNTHLWQTADPYDSPRRPALQRATGFITDDRVGGIHLLNSHMCIMMLEPAQGSASGLTYDNKKCTVAWTVCNSIGVFLLFTIYSITFFSQAKQKACVLNPSCIVGRVPIQTAASSSLNSPSTDF